jgi:hypothetical protein
MGMPCKVMSNIGNVFDKRECCEKKIERQGVCCLGYRVGRIDFMFGDNVSSVFLVRLLMAHHRQVPISFLHLHISVSE